MPKLNLIFEFDRVFDEDFPEDGSWLELAKIELGPTDLTDEEILAITEDFAQTDFYWIEVSQAILTAINNDSFTFRKKR